MGAVLCVGEALISLVAPAGTPLESADELFVSAGGAELNVAVHLARLGVATRFAGRVGSDAFGRRLRRTLEDAGVDAAHLEEDPDRVTGMYVKDVTGSVTTMRYYRSASAATTYRHVPDQALHGVEHVHLTGITPALSADCLALVQDLLGAHRVHTSFDVNYRRALWDPAVAGGVLEGLAQEADTVFVGLDEAAEIWGCATARDVRRVLPRPAELVVKDGAHEAVAFVGSEIVSVPAPRVEVVEPVGAGDAFAAGYLAARTLDREPEVALRWGHGLAGAVLQQLGDHGIHVGREQLEAMAEGGAATHGTR
ncbi:sugar kinase [Terrabacter sp. MAHUQ-38]|uniref:sugar kinase n=1 Tax=unclassified Terrabacter TaxID=2630222 RepID=UPI00165E0678|nr:sugar kinase [Terrabacter sp. MAHUQ-38]MBC9822640.1 sugar kinase [Terrabacter sp. MAHUQ-38]